MAVDGNMDGATQQLAAALEIDPATRRFSSGCSRLAR
jgi:hypothetical protein